MGCEPVPESALLAMEHRKRYLCREFLRKRGHVLRPRGVKTGNWKMREEHVSLERGTIHPRSLVQA